MGIFKHESAEVADSAKIGEGTKIWNDAHIRENVVIGENCIVGKCVYIDKNVKIGNNVKLQNNATVYDGVIIADDVLVGPHVVFTNDMYPRATSTDWKIVKTTVNKGASFGANSTIICGITVGEYAMIGAGSVVTKDVPEQALVYGNPAKIRGFVCKCGSKLKIKSDEAEIVIMLCAKCNQEFEIPKSVHESIDD